MYKDDEKSNVRRADLQSRQIDEAIASGRRISGELSREEALIDEFYGPPRKALTSQIQEISEKLQQRGFQGMLYRAAQGRSARDDLEVAERSLENLDSRSGEMREKLRNNALTKQENIALKHDIQREYLEIDIHNPSAKPRSHDVSSASVVVDNGLKPDAGMSKGRSR